MSTADVTSVTLVNVFTAKPGKQNQLAEVLAKSTRSFFSKRPGSLSSMVVVATDGTRVVNISQWRSADDIAAFRQDPGFADCMQAVLEVGSGESLMGHIAYVHQAKLEA